MGTQKLTFCIIIATVLSLTVAVSSYAQDNSGYKSGQKYPASTGIDLKKPIGPGGMIMGESGQRQNKSNHFVGEITMHRDTMISHSVHPGYTIKEIYGYDTEGKLLTILSKVPAGSTWENYLLFTFTYDQAGNVLTETDQYWDGAGWVDYLTFTYTYDSQGNRITVLYNDIMSGFVELITSTYDSDGNRLTELGTVWDGNSWVNLEYYTYWYTPRGDLQKMVGQQWDGTAWVNILREKWTYNANHQWMTDLLELHDGLDWVNYSFYTNQYDSRGNKTSFTGKYWFGGSGWTKVFRGFYTYDVNDNLLTSRQQYYINWEYPPYWLNTDSTANEFDYEERKITGSGYVWDGAAWNSGETSIYIPFMDNGNTLVFANEYPSHLVEVFYSPIETDLPLIAAEEMPGEFTLSAGPNPVTGSFTIQISNPRTENFKIQLYDPQGRMIRMIFEGLLTEGDHQIRVASPEYGTQGLFILQAVSPSETRTIKLIRQ